jgi:hypothetical protein
MDKLLVTISIHSQSHANTSGYSIQRMAFRIGHHIAIQLSPLKTSSSTDSVEHDVALVNSTALDALNRLAKLDGLDDCDDEDFYISLRSARDRQSVRWKARDRKKKKSLIVHCRLSKVSISAARFRDQGVRLGWGMLTIPLFFRPQLLQMKILGYSFLLLS